MHLAISTLRGVCASAEFFDYTGYFEIINADLVAVDFEVDILGTDLKTGTTQAPLVHYHGLGLGVRKDSGWRIRLARVYPVAK